MSEHVLSFFSMIDSQRRQYADCMPLHICAPWVDADPPRSLQTLACMRSTSSSVRSATHRGDASAVHCITRSIISCCGYDCETARGKKCSGSFVDCWARERRKDKVKAIARCLCACRCRCFRSEKAEPRTGMATHVRPRDRSGSKTLEKWIGKRKKYRGHSPVDSDGSLPMPLAPPLLPVSGDCARANEINPTVLSNASAMSACTVTFSSIFCTIVHRCRCDVNCVWCKCWWYLLFVCLVPLRLPDSVVAFRADVMEDTTIVPPTVT